MSGSQAYASPSQEQYIGDTTVLSYADADARSHSRGPIPTGATASGGPGEVEDQESAFSRHPLGLVPLFRARI